MCFSESQSQKTLILNTITCYILYVYYDKSDTHRILALFFKFVGFMQLFDLIFWRNQNIQDPNEALVNYTVTKIAMLANHLQPIILALLIYAFTGSLGKLSQIILLVYTIVIIYYSIFIWNKITYTLEEKIEENDSRSSLRWEWNLQKNNFRVYSLFIITLSIMAYENFDYPIDIILLCTNLSTFLLSAYYFKAQFIGRFWCKIAAFIPIMFIFIKPK